MFRWLLAVAATVTLSLALGARLAECEQARGSRDVGSAGELLAGAELVYHEDGAGRAVAEVRAELRRTGAEARLSLRISAVGPAIEPVPGFAGIQGANLLVAQELERIVGEGLLVSETRRARGGALAPGRLRIVERGPLPARRLWPDGRLELEALTPVDCARVLEVQCDLPGPGAYQTLLVVRGRPRLVVRFRLDARGGAIESLRDLHEGSPRQ